MGKKVIYMHDIKAGETLRVLKNDFSKREFNRLWINHYTNYSMIIEGDYLIISRME